MNDPEVLLLDEPVTIPQISEATVVDNYPGFFNLHGMDLTKKFREHAKKIGVEIKDEEVVKIKKSGKNFKIKTDKNSGSGYESKTIIISTGAKHRIASIHGEELFSG